MLKKHSTADLTVTFNSGRSFTHSEIINQIATHDPIARIKSEWSDIVLQTPIPETAIVTNRIVETVGPVPHTYRFITVLVKAGTNWKVAAAQSTRVIELAPAYKIDESEKLQSYAGTYRTPGGVNLKIVLRDSSVLLIEPSGQETRIAPIGPDLFEIPQILSAGNVRFAFSRDATGSVTAMTRIAHRIVTMPRVKSSR